MKFEHRAVPIALAAVLIDTIGFGIIMPVFPKLITTLGHTDLEHATRFAGYLLVIFSLTQFIAGPMLALGLFTRVAAVPIVIFLIVTNVERWRVGKYFWNQLGLEYTLMWTIAAFYFLVNGAGPISLDHLIGRAF